MRSERARLTVLYGGLMVLAGVLLTGLVYLLLSTTLYATIDAAVIRVVPATPAGDIPASAVFGPTSPEASPQRGLAEPLPGDSPKPQQSSAGTAASIEIARKLTTAVNQAALRRLLIVSGLSLAVFTAGSAALAWWMAGRVLSPVGVITTRARQLSASNLHERLALQAPPGELKELADTFDGMLDRIELVVAAQQRFAANAAHQLRTPVAVQRAAAEIGLAGRPTPEKVAKIRDKLIENADESERLIEGLLLLAGSDQGIEHTGPVALHEIANASIAALALQAKQRRITVDVSVVPTTIEGDSVLLDQLVHNLLFNALIHNHVGGTVHVRVRQYEIEVANTGTLVSPEVVPRLFEPFQRARGRGHASGEGAGLGLSIVSSIARAHGAKTEATANPDGGLTVRVMFPDPVS